MSPERKQEALAALHMIHADIPIDLKVMDGAEMTGRAVGTQFGNLCAQVDTLTLILIDMLNGDVDA